MEDMLYNSLTILLGLVGAWAFFGQLNVYVPIKKLGGKRGAATYDPYKEAGWGITATQFNALRYVIYTLIGVMLLNQYHTEHQLSMMALGAYVAFIAITVPSMPKISIIPRLLHASMKSRAKRMNDEVLMCFIHMKNLSLIDADLNAYEIMRKLLRQTKELRPYMAELIKSWHVLDARAEALKGFEDTVGTSEAAKFAKLIVKADTSKLANLSDELTFYEQGFYETRQTARESRNNTLGSVFYAASYSLIVAILVDFIYVAILSSLNLQLVQ